VICEFLDSVGDAPRLIPPEGPARWRALTLAALGDGILDATQPRRREVALPQDEGRVTYIAQQQLKVTRALAVLEKESLGMLETIGDVAVACALGYLDFRYPHEPWRPGHPTLEAWYAKVAALPAMARTVPPG
jgi:glutathione S-transferase